MSNMAYCRFRNTLAELRACYDAIDDEVSDDEENAREDIIRLCEIIASEYGSQSK